LFKASSQEKEPRSIRRYVLRSSGGAAPSIAAITATVAAFDPTATMRYALLDTQVTEAMLQERLMARLSTIFGGVALLLAVVGLYGVVSYTVASRRAEIGVRVALGASRSHILSMILGDIGRVLAAGLVVGSGLALLAARAIGSLLYGLAAGDLSTLMMAAGVMAGVGAIAALWPARRATGIDPVSALRES
jgi:ABC-type antimicrobial peptide transport system permease subunit